ncbi:MAG: hypothetical protein D6753_09815 [Planctomycetota bacterium]|nr:MAG: hypothetical protein D6753_09815 [Planctomycetota bacterium]
MQMAAARTPTAPSWNDRAAANRCELTPCIECFMAPSLSLDALLIEWESRRDREGISAPVREELADVEAGRHRDAT